jgi:hypothetical protein
MNASGLLFFEDHLPLIRVSGDVESFDSTLPLDIAHQ